MGIDVWELRDRTGLTEPSAGAEQAAPVATGAESLPATEPPPDVHGFDWDPLNDAIRSCTGCTLHASRTQAVCGVGNHQADWLVIGEAPGQEEDRQGEPFVGRAGQLLNEMLRAIGLQREQVFIANILKCRPPNNRDPEPDEIATCLPYLQRQIALLQPKIILVVGRIAAHALLQTTTPIGK
ncbi:MAG: uracil-DNA glycosylase, partial [Gammaproteobacteria bacterium]|nr:uracil-DNA glycosylase [Gammaproteobacteria bacterium]